MKQFHLLLGALAASIATMVAVVIVHDPLPTPADPFAGLHLSAPLYNVADVMDEDLSDDEVLDAPFVSYQSDTYGYKLTYPGNWELDDTRSEYSGDILSDPTQRVVITISETKDQTLMTPQGMETLVTGIRESLRVDPAFKLESLQRLIWKQRPTIFTDGVLTLGTKRYHTRKYNIFRANHGGILNVSVTTQEDAEPLYERALLDILNSLDVCPEGRIKVES